MNILKLFIIVSLVTIISSCTKDKLGSNIDVFPETIKNELSVQYGMLVFDSEDSFYETLEQVGKMGELEKRNWEEHLGFKSFDRSIHEVRDKQNEYEESFVDTTKEELEKGFKSGGIEEYLPITKEYIDKGIIEIIVAENNEINIEIHDPLYSSLVNIEGFVAVGNEIRQYTRSKESTL